MAKSNKKLGDLSAFLISLILTLSLAGGVIYFLRTIWPNLPAWLVMIFYVLLAVIVIGYPIYSLARWSDRYLARKGAGIPPPHKQGPRKNHPPRD